MTDRRRFTYVPLLVSESIMRGKLTHIQSRVFLALLHHYNPKTKDPVFPSRRTISRLTGIHTATISKATRELEQAGFITKHHIKGCSVKYTLNPLVVDSTTGVVADSATLTDQGNIAPLGIASKTKPDCAVPKAGASGSTSGDSASRRGQISDGGARLTDAEFCERIVDEFKDCPF